MRFSSKEKKYVVNDEFNTMALCLIEKYPKKFHSVNIQKLCCVNLYTTEKSDTEILWKIQRVKMPMALHCQYEWYVVFRSADWDEWNKKKQMSMVGDVLMCLKD